MPIESLGKPARKRLRRICSSDEELFQRGVPFTPPGPPPELYHCGVPFTPPSPPPPPLENDEAAQFGHRSMRPNRLDLCLKYVYLICDRIGFEVLRDSSDQDLDSRCSAIAMEGRRGHQLMLKNWRCLIFLLSKGIQTQLRAGEIDDIGGVVCVDASLLNSVSLYNASVDAYHAYWPVEEAAVRSATEHSVRSVLISCRPYKEQLGRREEDIMSIPNVNRATSSCAETDRSALNARAKFFEDEEIISEEPNHQSKEESSGGEDVLDSIIRVLPDAWRFASDTTAKGDAALDFCRQEMESRGKSLTDGFMSNVFANMGWLDRPRQPRRSKEKLDIRPTRRLSTKSNLKKPHSQSIYLARYKESEEGAAIMEASLQRADVAFQEIVKAAESKHAEFLRREIPIDYDCAEFKAAVAARTAHAEMVDQLQKLKRNAAFNLSRAGGKKKHFGMGVQARGKKLQGGDRQSFTCYRKTNCPFYNTSVRCRGGRECDRKYKAIPDELENGILFTPSQYATYWKNAESSDSSDSSDSDSSSSSSSSSDSDKNDGVDMMEHVAVTDEESDSEFDESMARNLLGSDSE